jgi:hypothetical protein
VGYVRKQKVFRVEFTDEHSLAGLELLTRSLSIKEFAEFGLQIAAIGEVVDSASSPEDQLLAISQMSTGVDMVKKSFADALISWNMEEEDGSPTPPTADGVGRLDDMEFLSMVGSWLEALGGVLAPVGKGSGSGETTPELSLPMDISSPSPGNSPTPN